MQNTVTPLRAATPEAHRVSIPAQAGPGGYAHLARCSCGWMDSIARGTRADAEAAAAEHVAAASEDRS